jgi:hypothetical protein
MNLETITVSEATELAKTQGELRLDTLKELSKEVAFALSKHSGTTYGRPAILSLGGLQTLSLDAARALQSHTGGLSLSGLTDISADLAAALAGHSGRLYLNGIHILQKDAAKRLAKYKGELVLNGLTELSAETAEALSSHGGMLSLKGLKTLTPDAALHLAKHRGKLKLNGITSISAKVAKSLEGYAGLYLEMSGLREFPDPVVESLAKIHSLWVINEGQDRIGEMLLADMTKAGTAKSDTGDFDGRVLAIALKEQPKLRQARNLEKITNFLKRPKNLFVGIIDALRRGDSWGTACKKLDDDEVVAALVVYSIGGGTYVLESLLDSIMWFEDTMIKDREYIRNFLKDTPVSTIYSDMEKGIKLLKFKDNLSTKKGRKKTVRANPRRPALRPPRKNR